MSRKKLRANRRNQKRAHLPAPRPPGGDPEAIALFTLGEDPGEFAALAEKLRAEWSPAGVLEGELVERLARALWRMKRADRMLEGLALRRAKEQAASRHARFAAQMVSARGAWAGFDALRARVSRVHYVATDEDLALVEDLCSDELGAMKNVLLAFFLQLRAPEAPGAAAEPAVPPEAGARALFTNVRAVFGLSPEPEEDELVAAAPSSPPASGDARVAGESPPPAVKEDPERAQARRLLAFLLERAAALAEVRAHGALLEVTEGPSPYERAAEAAPAGRGRSARATAAWSLRLEEASFRQVWRLTNLLTRMRRLRAEEEGKAAFSHDVN